MDNYLYGKVVWFNAKKGYGFIAVSSSSSISSSDGASKEDVFVHFSDIICKGYKTLKPEQDVKFKMGANYHGRPKAIEVEVILN